MYICMYVHVCTVHLLLTLGAETAAANAVHFFDPASLTVLTDTPPHAGSGGWSCKVAAVVWLRMLKVLGNVNDIQQPAAHAEAMAGLYQIWSSLKNVSYWYWLAI